jgi:predicted dehydrogenase
MTRPARVLIVGHGYAGSRFRRALTHLRRQGLPLEIVGVADVDRARHPHDLPGFVCVESALAALTPDVICVTVNESAHADVLAACAQLPSALLLLEKPLTATLTSAQALAPGLSGHMLSMNLVERFSRPFTTYRAWVAERGPLEAVRVEAFWGKHRLLDQRPTMGVHSELIHALDLIDHVFVPLAGATWQAIGVSSDFSPADDDVLESVDASTCVAGVPVTLHSSFVWPTRMRQVTALLRSPRQLFRATFDFDRPHWDCDHLQIVEIASSGRWEPVLEESTDITDVPEEIRGVGKLTSFLERSLRGWRNGARDADLVGLTEALKLQEQIEQIHRTARQARLSGSYRAEEAR